MDPKGVVNTYVQHIMILLCTDGQAILIIAILNFNCCIKMYSFYYISGEQMLSVFFPNE